MAETLGRGKLDPQLVKRLRAGKPTHAEIEALRAQVDEAMTVEQLHDHYHNELHTLFVHAQGLEARIEALRDELDMVRNVHLDALMSHVRRDAILRMIVCLFVIAACVTVVVVGMRP